MRNGILSLVIIGLLLLLVACDTKTGESIEVEADRFKIGVVLKSMDSEYTYAMNSGIVSAAEDFGITVITVYPEVETDVEKQRMMIMDMLSSGVDMMLICPCDSEDTRDYMAVAAEKNIPVFSVDTEMYYEDEVYIGSDNYQIGQLAGEEMDRLLGGQGKVAIMAGTLIQSPHYKRVKGFKDYIGQNTEIEIVYEGEAYSRFLDAVYKTEELLKEHPEVDGIFVSNATMTLGIVDRMELMGMDNDIRIVGVDTQSDTLHMIQEGKISAMISQNGYDITYKAIEVAYEYLNGKEFEGNIIIENEIIRLENVDEFLKIIAR